MRAVTVIPATISRFTANPIKDQRKRRVAGYARVSTDNEEQLTSYEAQVDYYTNYIKGRDDWEFAGLYTDEGISATNTKKREGFNRMVADALAGKIDLIVTKSVSRFARNTVDSLTTVRNLKEKGIEVYFEKENIWTLDSKGELLITIMSSLAQEESRSISENVTWGQRKRFSDGKVCVPYSRFLGYDKGEDGVLKINEEEAVTVRLIYRMFLDGYSPYAIAKHLTTEGILSPGGKKKWNRNSIKSILSNEKYKGDALLQKSYTVDFLTKKKKINEGEVPQYYVKNAHEAIVDPQVFEMAQRELARRSTNRHSSTSFFSSRIKCGSCGSWYGAKVWHSNSKYRRVVYQCNSKFKQKCKTPHLTENEIKGMFVATVNQVIASKEEIIEGFELIENQLFDTTKLEIRRREFEVELAIAAELIQKCIEENASVALDQGEYRKRYDGLVRRYEEAKEGIEETKKQILEKRGKGEKISAFISDLSKQEALITKFDKELWCSLVDYATVSEKGEVRFTFKDGTEIRA